ncbi:hypothetical protein GUJ93_ZPchr0006g45694 [Zizania palustris]|uniref:Uncharacterized protein n=1 Tax=Zizania palustris TaxID=103762 RepID=A0A8J5VTY7_ZIZPA|nr:hypothetical protein GUJ93_ZPchr0006g45694 [Zizania palustris]
MGKSKQVCVRSTTNTSSDPWLPPFPHPPPLVLLKGGWCWLLPLPPPPPAVGVIITVILSSVANVVAVLLPPVTAPSPVPGEAGGQRSVTASSPPSLAGPTGGPGVSGSPHGSNSHARIPAIRGKIRTQKSWSDQQ